LIKLFSKKFRMQISLIKLSFSERKFKGQVSMEMLAVFSLLLVPIVISFLYSYSIVSDAIRSYHLQTSMDRLAQASEELYSQGKGARARLFLSLPSGLYSMNSYIGDRNGGQGHHIVLNISGDESFRVVDAEVYGTWPATPNGKIAGGIAAFDLAVNDSNVVIIQKVK